VPSWKKIIVSGSNAELNQLTATSYGGNISGSSTSTGSFGRTSTDTLDLNSIQGNWTNAGNTVADLGTVTTADINGGTIDGITSLTAGGDLDIGAHDLRAATITADSLTATRVPFAGTDGVLSDDSDLTFATATLSATNLTTTGTIKNMALVSGSSTSTGSFGKLLGDGSSLTGIDTDLSGDTTPQLGGNLDLNSNNITGTGNIDILGTITAQNFIVSSSVTSIEYQSISGSTIFGDTEDDTHEFIGHVMMQSASFGMANHADRTNSNAANSYLFISQSVASKNGYVWQKAGNPGTNTFPFLLIDSANNQKASIRQDGRFSTPIVYLSNDNSGKLGEIDGDAGDSSAMYINANSRALQLSSEGKKTFKINTDGTTEIGGSGAYGVTNFGDLTVGGNLNLTSSAATLEVAGNISGSLTSTGSFGVLKLASYNSALGGSDNTIFGKGAGVDLTSGNSNTLIGTSAGANLTTDANVVAIGQNAGFTGTTKLTNSVLIGKGALQAGSQSQNSVVIGSQAGYSLSSTHTNGTVALGHQSQYRSETGRYNTGLGYGTLRTNIDGDSNTAVGYASMFNFEAASDGEGDNTAVGTNALNNATTGTHNTAVGSHVARTGTNDLTTGTGNTLIGSYAALSSGSAVNEIVIGSGSIGLGDNQTVIGNSGQTHVVFGGDALISGSAQSTGSFGKLLGDGSSLTGVSADVVDDTSPQLGGDLDLNSNDITGTGNINMVGTHQITGSLNISGSSDPLTVNSAGSNGIGLLLQGDVISQTPLIKFKSAGGNLPAGGTIGFTNGGFQFTSTVTSTGTINANGGFATSLRGSQNAIKSTNGGNAGIGFTGLGGNAGIDFQTSDTTRLDIAVDGTVTIVGDTVIGGDLTVNGDTTTISTTNILVQDAFGFFATGSAGTNVDAGIIVQSGSFVDSGSALYHDISSERWSVGKGIASTATNVPDSKWGGFVATVYTASASPVGSSPKYGVGEIHVDDDGEIYIYS